MPGDAVVNPAELRNFALALNHFDQQLLDLVTRLHAAFASVSETWRDSQQEKFGQEFEQMTTFLRHFHDSAEEHIPLILGKAEVAQRYLDMR